MNHIQWRYGDSDMRRNENEISRNQIVSYHYIMMKSQTSQRLSNRTYYCDEDLI